MPSWLWSGGPGPFVPNLRRHHGWVSTEVQRSPALTCLWTWEKAVQQWDQGNVERTRAHAHFQPTRSHIQFSLPESSSCIQNPETAHINREMEDKDTCSLSCGMLAQPGFVWFLHPETCQKTIYQPRELSITPAAHVVATHNERTQAKHHGQNNLTNPLKMHRQLQDAAEPCCLSPSNPRTGPGASEC